jgi:hypothetical protein
MHRGLNETGYVEDQNVMVEYHWLEGQYDRDAIACARPRCIRLIAALLCGFLYMVRSSPLPAHAQRITGGKSPMVFRQKNWLVAAHAVLCFEVLSWDCGVSTNESKRYRHTRTSP